MPDHNEWRRLYDEMSYQEQQEYYDTILEETPDQLQFNRGWFLDMFQRIENEMPLPYAVMEFGGYQGEMAHLILRKCPQIVTWRNYEITTRALKYRVCSDPRYEPIVLDRFLWKEPMSWKHNVFVASHSFEHIRGWQAKKIIDEWVSVCEVALLEIPLPKKGIADWTDYPGTHILDVDWATIRGWLSAHGFENFKTNGDNLAAWKPTVMRKPLNLLRREQD